MHTGGYLGLEIFGAFMLILILVFYFTLVKPINSKKDKPNNKNSDY